MSTTGGYDSYPFVAEFYDHVVPYRDRNDVAFYVEAAKASGGPVLELGCGTGRLLIPTARAGVAIVGIDATDAMLAVCRAKLAREPREVRERVRTVHGDMRQFHDEERFALVTIPFRAFQHLLDVEDQLACLACARRHLRPGGRLILDIFNPLLAALVGEEYLTERGEEPAFVMPDGRSVVRRHRLAARDFDRQINDCELIYYVTHEDGRRERLVHAFPMRYLFRFEAEHLLVRGGFEIEALYADYAKVPHGSENSGELIFVARRPADA